MGRRCRFCSWALNPISGEGRWEFQISKKDINKNIKQYIKNIKRKILKQMVCTQSDLRGGTVRITSNFFGNGFFQFGPAVGCIVWSFWVKGVATSKSSWLYVKWQSNQNPYRPNQNKEVIFSGVKSWREKSTRARAWKGSCKVIIIILTTK